MALGSVANYKTYAGITGSGYDTVLTALLAEAEAILRRACGRNMTDGFESASRTEYYDGTGSESFSLVEWPVTSITSIAYLADDGTESTVTSAAYRLDGGRGFVYMLGAQRGRFVGAVPYTAQPGFSVNPRWEPGYQNIKVVYTGGYSTIPKDIEYAVYRLIDVAFASRGSAGNIQSESIGAYSRTMADAAEIDARFLRLIAPFRTGAL